MSRPTYFDETISKAESIRYLNKHRDDIQQLRRHSHFKIDEIENLYLIHYKIVKNGGPINPQRFQELACNLLGIQGDQFYEKIYSYFDKKSRGSIPPVNWVEALSVLLRGNLEEQIDFVWGVYAPHKEGSISREQMLQLMRKAIIKGKNDTGYESMAKDITTLLMKKLDLDSNGRINYENFRDSILRNSLLLECLGPCLPNPECVVAFLATFSEKKEQLKCLPFPRKKDDDTDAKVLQLFISDNFI